MIIYLTIAAMFILLLVLLIILLFPIDFSLFITAHLAMMLLMIVFVLRIHFMNFFAKWLHFLKMPMRWFLIDLLYLFSFVQRRHAYLF